MKTTIASILAALAVASTAADADKPPAPEKPSATGKAERHRRPAKAR